MTSSEGGCARLSDISSLASQMQYIPPNVLIVMNTLAFVVAGFKIVVGQCAICVLSTDNS